MAAHPPMSVVIVIVFKNKNCNLFLKFLNFYLPRYMKRKKILAQQAVLENKVFGMKTTQRLNEWINKEI